MPAPARTSDAAVVAAARALLERGGPGAVTMQAAAAAVGIRGPSLYKRFADRGALIAGVEAAAVADLGAALAAVPAAGGPRARLRAQAAAFRDFARAEPRAYALIFDAGAATGAAADAARAAAVTPVLGPLAALAGEARALSAARLLTAFLHGFVSMEAAGLFRLGGDVDAAFEEGLGMILDGLRPGR